MAEKKPAFSVEEKAAMRAAVKEAKENKSREESLKAVEEAIAKMTDEDRVLAQTVHDIVRAVAPELDAKTFYGMPAYARDGKVVVFFKNAGKFGERYATLGFEGAAGLDDGNMWPTSWAVTKLSKADEKVIADLVKRAAG